jgi:hypothetical protein
MIVCCIFMPLHNLSFVLMSVFILRVEVIKIQIRFEFKLICNL